MEDDDFPSDFGDGELTQVRAHAALSPIGRLDLPTVLQIHTSESIGNHKTTGNRTLLRQTN